MDFKNPFSLRHAGSLALWRSFRGSQEPGLPKPKNDKLALEACHAIPLDARVDNQIGESAGWDSSVKFTEVGPLHLTFGIIIAYF
jgi:hypothetical protein